MDCPQCGATLATYALDGREASVCEDCGYVGISAEHRGDAHRVESWDDALRRFYRAHGSDADPSVELRPPLSRPSRRSEGESWTDALRRFYERRTSDEDDERGGGDGAGANGGSGPTTADTASDATDGDGDGEADESVGANGVDGTSNPPSVDEADESAAVDGSTTRSSQSSAGDS